MSRQDTQHVGQSYFSNVIRHLCVLCVVSLCVVIVVV